MAASKVLGEEAASGANATAGDGKMAGKQSEK